MSKQIDPRAIVAEKAFLEDGVKVGPYAMIGDNARIGKNTTIEAFAQVLGYTEIGEGCRIFSHAVVGSIPQDLKYKGDRSFLTIGSGNIIREFVTINPGTEKDSRTVIGNDNLIMAYVHVAHDCFIGSGNIIANGVTFAGYVEVEDKVVIGGLVAIHQFCRIGRYCVIGGCSKVVQDIPPYAMCDGHPARVKGINSVGLKRAGFTKETISDLKRAFKILFFQGHSIGAAKIKIKDDFAFREEIKYILDFLSLTKRGICG